MTLNRSRWAAVGAAVAVTLGAGSIGLVKAADSSDPSVFVPITNCRIFDTRPNHDIGPFNTPLGPAAEITIAGHGETGECTIPDTATALQLNVTAVEATATTHLTIYPADSTLPNASSLNPQLGHGTAWNSVTTRLSPEGEFKVYNLLGQINVLADVTGYFVASDAVAGPKPAFAVTDGDDVTGIGATDTVVAEATISADGAGVVQATAVGTASGPTSASPLTCSLSDGAAFDDGSAQSVDLTAASSISAMRAFPLTAAGDLTVSLVCKATGVSGTATVANPQLSLTYLPGDVPTP